MRCLAFCLLALSCCAWARAGDVRVAVAANFAVPLRALAADFQARSGHGVLASPASTGRHHAQIVAGAPFDVFLAADSATPARLEREGRAVAGTRFTYAVGRLVLWSPQPGLVDEAGEVLARGGFRYLAIANPRLAPYGEAARQVLVARGLWQQLQPRLVTGENVAQAFQFVHAGHAELGFVAASQVLAGGTPRGGSAWHVPGSLHPPLRQDAVLLRDIPAARSFLDYLRSERAAAIILAHGYGTASP